MAVRNRAYTILVGLIATILLGWVLYVGASILQPLVIALFLASMLQPVVRQLAKAHIPPALTVLTIVVLLAFGLFRLGVLLQENVRAFVGQPLPRPVPMRPYVPRPIVPEPEWAQPDPVEAVDPGEDVAAGELVAPGELGDPDPQELDGPDEVADPAERAQDELASGEPGAYDETGELVGADEQDEQDEPPDERIEDPLDPIRESIPGAGEPTIEGGWDDVVERIETRLRATELPRPFVRSLVTSLREIDIASLATEVLGSSLGFAKGLFLVLLYMVFIFAEQAVFRRKILSVAGPRRADAAAVLDTIGRGIQRYLGVKTLASVLTGALCYLMLVWQGVDYALLFGIITFLLNYIPTFGSIIAGVLPATYALANGHWGTAVVIAVTYLAVNLTIGSFLEPKVLGRELNLSPLVIIISVVVWAGLWGVVGTFLAVPITSALQIVLASWDTTRPIAVLLSSGPPREHSPGLSPPPRRRRRRKAG